MDLKELPGADVLLPGLEDLHNGKSETVGALPITTASTHLTKAGLEFPKNHLMPEPEPTLYDRLQSPQLPRTCTNVDGAWPCALHNCNPLVRSK